MTTDGGAAAASPPDPGLERPAFLELFFDLVYVFALVTLATVLADDLTWTGVAKTLVLLLGFTMIWALTVWTRSCEGLEHLDQTLTDLGHRRKGWRGPRLEPHTHDGGARRDDLDLRTGQRTNQLGISADRKVDLNPARG